uniref:F-box domain-containing protein n=1 Tax=Ditylenchus dipsaci TaxID=166011 RepID=A0A915E3J0_9BILA
MLRQTISVDNRASEQTKSQKRRISSPGEEQTKRFAGPSSLGVAGKRIQAEKASATSFSTLFQPSETEKQVDCLEQVCRGASPVVISDWLQTFRVMPKDIQSDALKELVELCSVNQVTHLQNVIAPHFKRDFVSCLPREISLKILSYLSPKDLVRGALLCKCWKQLMEDSMLWMAKCKQYAVLEIFPPSLNRQENWTLVKSKARNAVMMLTIGWKRSQSCSKALTSLAPHPVLTSKDSCYARSKWKAIYLRNERIKKNWCTRRLTASCELRGHDEHVITCVQLHQDTLVTGSDDTTIRVWSSATAQCLYVLVGHQGGVWSLQLSEDGKTLISGSTDRTVRVWNLKQGLLIHTLHGHTSTVRCMSLKKHILVSGSRDSTIKVWNIQDGYCMRTLYGHIAAVRCVQFDGSKIVSGGYDNRIIVWDYNTGVQKGKMSKIQLKKWISEFSEGVFTTDGRVVYCQPCSKQVSFNAQSKLLTESILLRSWLTFSEIGQQVRDKLKYVLDKNPGINRLSEITNVLEGRESCLNMDPNMIASMKFAPIMSCDVERSFSVYKNLLAENRTNITPEHLEMYMILVLEGHTNRVYALLYESHRDMIISGSLDTTIKVWNSRTGECLQTLVGHQSLTSGMQLRGDLLVSANADSTIKVWNILDGQCLHTLAGQHRHSSAVTSLQFLENGLVATSGDDGFVKLWDVKKGAFICNLVQLASSGAGGCVWRLKATPTMLVCAVGSRNGTEDTKLMLMDFDSAYP